MRSVQAAKNVTVSMILQIVVIICGLITPRYIITAYGSGYNGITASVVQFLSIISLLRAGVGGVTRAALYKPLAIRDNTKISSILRATEIFMRRIALIFLAYVILLAIVYPFFFNSEPYGGWIAVSSYILILSIGTFAQYYFCMAYQLLLTADQREYIANSLQIIQVILNTVIVVLFVRWGLSIHAVKLFSAIAFMITPIVLHIYVKKHYLLIPKSSPDFNAIGQRWDAFAHNVADFIHGNTDVLLLTVLSGNIAIISVYSVYYLVVNGIKKVVTICTTGLEAAFGNIIATGDTGAFNRTLSAYEFFIYTLTTVLFACVLILIVPFVTLYTSGVTDINYHHPVFAIIATIAEVVYCVRIPYSAIVYANGHYRQTKKDAIYEAAINLILSLSLVLLCRLFNQPALMLVSVAVGTLLANAFRTWRFMKYLYKVILHRPLWAPLLRFAVMITELIVIGLIAWLIHLENRIQSPFSFIIYGAFSLFLIAASVIGINGILYTVELKTFYSYVASIIKSFTKGKCH